MISRQLKASYTVEAAIIMSVTFFVLAALLIGTFYLHDRAVLQAVSCETVAAGNNMATEKEQKQVTSEIKNSLTRQRLLGSKNISGEVTVGKKKIRASWSGESPVPGFVMNYLTGNKLPIAVSWEGERLQPTDTIRKIRGVRKLINGGIR